MYLLVLQRLNEDVVPLEAIAGFPARPAAWEPLAGPSHHGRIVKYSAKLHRALQGDLPGLSPLALAIGPPWTVLTLKTNDEPAIDAALASVGLVRHTEE